MDGGGGDGDASARPSCIAVLTAMPMELKPVAKRLRLAPATLGGLRVRRGSIGATTVVATHTGMGVANARRVTEQLLTVTGAERLVVVGIAGGIDPDLRIGEVVVPDVVVLRDSGAEFHAHPTGDQPVHGRIVTGDGLSLTEDLDPDLAEQGVTAVDMETAAMAEVAERRGCPWIAFRAISDRESDGLVDDAVFHLAKPDGGADLGAALRYVARHPRKIPVLARLGRDTQKATAAAAEAGARCCRALASA